MLSYVIKSIANELVVIKESMLVKKLRRSVGICKQASNSCFVRFRHLGATDVMRFAATKVVQMTTHIRSRNDTTRHSHVHAM